MGSIVRKVATLAAVFVLSATMGCASQTDDGGSEGAAAAERATTWNDVSGAFAVDYGLGILAGDRLVDLPRETLMETLPEGDARVFAQCLVARHDVVKGDTLSGSTWGFEGRRYYVLITELEDGGGLTDVRMLFVFSSDGVSRFSVLAWDGKKNLKISYDKGTPCSAAAPATTTTTNGG